MRAFYKTYYYAVFVICLSLNVLVETVTLQHKRSSQCDSICTTPGCVHAASEVLKNLDLSVDPCDDFYQFACGGFMKSTVIPDDKPRVMKALMISDTLDDQLRTIVEEPIRPNEPRPFVLLKKFYKVCLDTDAIEKDDLKTAKSILHQLGGWPMLEGSSWNEAEFDWKETVYKSREIGIPGSTFVQIGVGVDAKNSSRHMINIGQGRLGLDRDYLIEGVENDVFRAYYEYLLDLAVIFGANKETAIHELKDSIEFARKLANITLTKEERRDMAALSNQMTIKELQERYPSVNWLEYINNILSVPNVKITEDEVVDVASPKYLKGLETLLSETKKRVQANFMMCQLISAFTTFLTKEVQNREMKFDEIAKGTHSMKPRWKDCLDNAEGGMNIAIGALYVRTYFDENARQNAKTLVSDIQASFIDILKQIDWMDEVTRKSALEKVNTIASHIAYPTELLDDKKLEKYYAKLESSDNYLELALKLAKFMVDKSMEKIHQAVNKSDWTEHGSPAAINAYYTPMENSIQLPAGILQGSFFDNSRPNYMNYGAIGYVIGHEITHGFDDMGRQFNKDGDLVDWWAESTKQAFMKKAKCIIDQYSSYVVPEVNMTLNGINTQGENIADNGGIKEAYIAYNAWVERNGPELQLPGLDYTPKQMFWISAANLWCTKQRKELTKLLIRTDTHSPNYFRVIGPFSNTEYFSQDFNCPLGSRMNPKHKCQVW